MMSLFKERYKSANDKIASDVAYERFITNLGEHRRRDIRPAVIKAAALAACFVVSVCGIGLYREGSKIPENVSVISPSSAPEGTAAKPENVPEGGGMVRDIGKENNRSGAQPTPATEKKMKKATEQPLQEPEKTEAISEEPELSANNDISEAAIVPEAEETAEQPEVRSFSAAEDATDALKKTDGISVRAGGASAQTRTLADYNSYIGRDIRENICIPDGMTDETPPTVSGGEGWVYVYDGGGKHVEIKTAPAAAVMSLGVAEDAEEMDGEDSAASAASFSDGGIDFEITAEGFTEEELNKLIESLKNE